MEWINGINRMNERNEWTNERGKEWVIKRVSEWLIEWLNEWMNEWMNEWITSQWIMESTCERMDEHITFHISFISYLSEQTTIKSVSPSFVKSPITTFDIGWHGNEWEASTVPSTRSTNEMCIQLVISTAFWHNKKKWLAYSYIKVYGKF